MESLDYHQIKDYCREAQALADTYSPYDGLSFLIGEKFYSLFQALKQAQAKVQFLYNTKEVQPATSPLDSGNVEIQEGYMLAIQNNYEKALEKIDDLTQLRDDFIGEIKEAFELSDIHEYLDSYPRLGIHELESTGQFLSGQDSPPIEFKEVMTEVDDIFLVEEIKKHFV